MIELPKCPHCGKLLVGSPEPHETLDPETFRPVSASLEMVWRCPVTMDAQKPTWVTVRDDDAFRTRF